MSPCPYVPVETTKNIPVLQYYLQSSKAADLAKSSIAVSDAAGPPASANVLVLHTGTKSVMVRPLTTAWHRAKLRQLVSA